MNAKQTKLLADADAMSESTLVSMEDWELAYLRVAMRNQVEETLNAALFDDHVERLHDDASDQNIHKRQLVEAAR